MMGYNELCDAHQKESGQWKITWDDHHKGSYASKGDQWCGFDTQRSIGLKVDYLKSMGLAGGMVWSLDTDDFKGRCHGERYPLLNTIHRGLSNVSPTKPTHISTVGPDPLCNSAGNFEIAGECQRFYTCLSEGGKLTMLPRTCPNGESFDRQQKICLLSSLVAGCGLTTQGPVIPTDAPVILHCSSDGKFRHPQDCTQYYLCEQNVDGGFRITVFHCPANLMFSIKSLTCDYPDNVPDCSLVRASSLPTEGPITRPSSTTSRPIAITTTGETTWKCTAPGNFRHPDTCSKFYTCQDNGQGGFKMVEFSCPTNLVFSPEHLVCDYREKVPGC